MRQMLTPKYWLTICAPGPLALLGVPRRADARHTQSDFLVPRSGISSSHSKTEQLRFCTSGDGNEQLSLTIICKVGISSAHVNRAESLFKGRPG